MLELPLKKLDDSFFRYDIDSLKEYFSSLESFLDGEEYLNTLKFARKVMFSHEIKANNQIEGYGDDINVIKSAITNAQTIKDVSQRNRIINLYNAYNYILNNLQIDKKSLKELYSIISRDLLGSKDLENMGEYYRAQPVYILKNGRLDMDFDEGLPHSRVEEFMDCYFNYLHSLNFENATDNYVQSQILHFYFVYIHPYFDVNGRTSRTVAMWYLLNNNNYPYIIFNRGISFQGSSYDKSIFQAKRSGDITSFLKMMLETVQIELEKEYVMDFISKNISDKMTAQDYQTLLYFLSMNGLKTVLDFASVYNSKNERKRALEIYRDMIVPLLDKGILDIERETGKRIGNFNNKVLTLRPFDYDKDKVQKLHF